MSADAIVKSFIDRILRLKEEQDALAKDIREIYAEAKGSGYDKTAMGQLVAHLRKVEKVGVSAVQEGQSIFDLYLEAYERASGTRLATHTHEAAEHSMSMYLRKEDMPAHDPETGEVLSGEITDQEQPETANEVPAQDGGGTATGEGPSDKSNAAHPVSEQELADADLNDGTAAGQTAIEVVTGGESAAIISPSAAPPAEAVAVAPQPSHAATAAIPEGIPAFLLKERKPLRPNCLNPENCAGYGSHTCHRCTRALAESEAA